MTESKKIIFPDKYLVATLEHLKRKRNSSAKFNRVFSPTMTVSIKVGFQMVNFKKESPISIR